MFDVHHTSVYLLPDEGQDCLLFRLTDADGIQDLTSRFLHFTSLWFVLQFARVFILLRAEGNQSRPICFVFFLYTQ